MREIEFRGLRPNGEFVYGYLSKDLANTTAYYNEYSYRIRWHPETGGVANAPVKNGTVGQYTGLKDCNGVKIFEGDRIAALDIVCEVMFEDGAFVISIGNFHRIKISSQYLIDNGFSVIGNIHETK